MSRILGTALLMYFCFGCPIASAAVQVVVDGRATAVLVTAEDASPVARHAAAELVEHVKMATRVELPVAVESDVPEGYASR